MLDVYKICSPPGQHPSPKVGSPMRERRQAHGGNKKVMSESGKNKNTAMNGEGGGGKMSKRPGKGNESDPHQSFANLDKSGYILDKRLSVLYTSMYLSLLFVFLHFF